MTLDIVSAEEYNNLCKNKYQYFYNSMKFHELNKNKVDNVLYIIFKERKNKLALAVGIDGYTMKIPYSAPFGIFEKLQNHIKIEDIENALVLLENFAISNNIKEIFFRIPPDFYDTSFIAKMQNCLQRQKYTVDACDLNYQFFINDAIEYEEILRRNARKNLKIAMKQKFSFIHCENEDDKINAYDVIAVNRKRKGYPLHMTYEQVKNTIQLTSHDFFIVREGNIDVAAAVVFQVRERYYQVIYWGDIEGYEAKRPMNYLAYYVYNFYLKKGIQILDIGPSTEKGVPNYGLCDFKESIGCEVDVKYTYVKTIMR